MENTIYELIMDGCAQSADADRRELAEDAASCACKYAIFRIKWHDYTMEEKRANDAYRTSAHNRFIDALRIYLRYVGSTGIEVPSPDYEDRKTIGDYACYIAYRLAVNER